MYVFCNTLTLLLEGYYKMVWKMSVCVCDPSVDLKNWTLLDFHTWCVYSPPKWQERALTNSFFTIHVLDAIKKGKKFARRGVVPFILPASNEA